jgi:hypothetical protein
MGEAAASSYWLDTAPPFTGAAAGSVEGRADLDSSSVPGHFGLRWFLPSVGAYYRVQDVIH